MTEPAPQSGATLAARRGWMLFLVALYTVLAVGALSRAGVQLATKASEAPIAYGLSAVSALIYLISGFLLRARTSAGLQWARRLIVLEIAGVILVGSLSMLKPEWFPEASVWSGFGAGYVFLPVLLPILAWRYLNRELIYLKL